MVRVAPKAWIGLAVVVGYTAIMAIGWSILDVDYRTVPDTTGSLLRGVVLTVGVAAAFAAGLTTWLGWWRPVMREDRAVPRWLWLFPAAMALLACVNIAGADFGRLGPAWVLSAAVGVALVGFGEELVCRGLALVGFRARFSEVVSWLLIGLLFGLLHAINALFGQDLLITVQQIVFAFLASSLLYLTRLVAGSLVPAMVLHALWDFGGFGLAASGSPGLGLVGLAYYLVLLGSVVTAFIVARRLDRAR